MIDATLSSFERDVIEASMEAPVLVDFWAPWCGPCASLGPILEKLERDYAGRWKLVKVNADTNPELVASFSLKSIPHVVAFVDGNAVAQFMGAQTESFVKAFIDRLVPNPGELEHRAAREAMTQGQPSVAETHLRNAIALDPACDAARLDMVAMLLDRDEVANARSHYQLLSGKAEQTSTYATVKARMEAAEIAATLPPAEVLESRIKRNDADLQARLQLAELHIARRHFEPAMQQLLEIARRDRAFGEDVGRRKMLEVFQMAAEQQALVDDYRHRLSAIVF